MTALISVDLDRTLIYSEPALGTALDASHLCVEMYEGKPLSYMSPVAAQQLISLASRSFVVPSTTRTVEQFRRIELPGAPWHYAITSNGGNILVDGEVDAAWQATVVAAIADSATPLAEVYAEMKVRSDASWMLKSRIADDLFCYLVVDVSSIPEDFVETWSAWCSERGWNVSQQGRKIYTMPNAVCKSRAVAEVHSRLVRDGRLDRDCVVLASGDGALDAEMLIAADAAIRPRHGELESIGWRHPTVEITSGSGIVASEEILNWFADRV